MSATLKDYGCRTDQSRAISASAVCCLVRHVPACLLVFFFLSGGRCHNLTCYSCYTEDQNDACYLNATSVSNMRCEDEEHYCSVYRVDRAGGFTFVARGCNETCSPVCGTWGDEVDEDRCTSCCTTSLCNVDDASAPPVTAPGSVTLLLLVTVTSSLAFRCSTLLGEL